MPPEVEKLRKMPVLLEVCPKCGTTPFEPFMRGQVQRSALWHPLSWLSWLWSAFELDPWPRYALICRVCKEVVGWEGCPDV